MDRRFERVAIGLDAGVFRAVGGGFRLWVALEGLEEA